jgi:hypothetical protein
MAGRPVGVSPLAVAVVTYLNEGMTAGTQSPAIVARAGSKGRAARSIAGTAQSGIDPSHSAVVFAQSGACTAQSGACTARSGTCAARSVVAI